MESMGQKGGEASKPSSFQVISFITWKETWFNVKRVRSISQHVTRSPAGAMCLLNASRGNEALLCHLRNVSPRACFSCRVSRGQCRIQLIVRISTLLALRAPKTYNVQLFVIGFATEAKNGSPQRRHTYRWNYHLKHWNLLPSHQVPASDDSGTALTVTAISDRLHDGVGLGNSASFCICKKQRFCTGNVGAVALLF